MFFKSLFFSCRHVPTSPPPSVGFASTNAGDSSSVYSGNLMHNSVHLVDAHRKSTKTPVEQPPLFLPLTDIKVYNDLWSVSTTLWLPYKQYMKNELEIGIVHNILAAFKQLIIFLPLQHSLIIYCQVHLCGNSLEMPFALLVVFLSQTDGASGYYGIETPLSYIRNLKTQPFFRSRSVRS